MQDTPTNSTSKLILTFVTLIDLQASNSNSCFFSIERDRYKPNDQHMQTLVLHHNYTCRYCLTPMRLRRQTTVARRRQTCCAVDSCPPPRCIIAECSEVVRGLRAPGQVSGGVCRSTGRPADVSNSAPCRLTPVVTSSRQRSRAARAAIETLRPCTPLPGSEDLAVAGFKSARAGMYGDVGKTWAHSSASDSNRLVQRLYRTILFR